MATHSNILAWRIPWTEEPGGLQPMSRKESNMTERLTLCCTIHSLLFSSMSFDKCIQPCGNHHCDIEQFHHFPQFFVLFVVNLSSHSVLSKR